MPLTGSLSAQLCVRLGRKLDGPVDITRAVPVGGGSINAAYRLDTNRGRFFVKVNSAERFPAMFDAEADGLRRLGATKALRVPQVIDLGADHDDAFLLLEHIDGGRRDKAFWERLGRGLATLHRHTAPTFGLERPNYIGSLVQVNTPANDWPTFLIRSRLEPMLKLAQDKRRVGRETVLRFEGLFNRLPDIFPTEPPALLHGDLWNGNLLCDTDGAPVLIDPAVHFGHREMDLAMTRLFGGFDETFHIEYHNTWPLEPGWEDRVDLCNLYPLLVHVNLFGGGYVQQMEEVMKGYS